MATASSTKSQGRIAALLCHVFVAVSSISLLQGTSCAGQQHANSSRTAALASQQTERRLLLNSGPKSKRTHDQGHDMEPRRPRLILHIGPHKTGTTSFQEGLASLGGLSPSLLYPDSCGMPTKGKGFADFAGLVCRNVSLSHAKYGNCNPRIVPKSLSLEPGGDIIVSSETFDSCLEAGFEKLHPMFPQFDIHVVYVHRRSGSLLLSNYHQLNKHKTAVPKFGEWRREYTKYYNECRHGTVACVELLAKVFGPDRVHVVSYEGMHEAQTSLAKVLCRLFSNAECFDLDSIQPWNVSPAHIEYSAATLYHQIEAKTNFSSSQHHCLTCKIKLGRLERFADALKAAGVRQECFVASSLPPHDRACNDDCFRETMTNGTLGVHTYYFEEAGSFEDTKMHCQFLESTAFSPHVLPKVLEATEAFEEELSTPSAGKKNSGRKRAPDAPSSPSSADTGNS